MPILNYTTTVPAVKSAGEIQGILVAHKAKSILMNYDDHGSIESLTFFAATPLGERLFRLPVDTEAVFKVLQKQFPGRRTYYSDTAKRDATQRAQAERVAWRIMKDWVEAQMAILEAQMVTLDQVFLPYMVNKKGETLYSQVAGGQLLLD